ncbi:hypothetical protein HKB06_07335, partial [Vibrio parahaemolyticus]|nr:hypothetical protein [Vibrio parahaemolyticus]
FFPFLLFVKQILILSDRLSLFFLRSGDTVRCFFLRSLINLGIELRFLRIRSSERFLGGTNGDERRFVAISVFSGDGDGGAFAVINGNGGRLFGLGTVGESSRVRVWALKARECLGATSEKGFEVFESD